MPEPLIRLTSRGLYCEAGGFHIDPWRAVPRAVITHAHADHATRGCQTYLCSESGRHPLAVRMQSGASIEALPFRVPTEIGSVRVTLFPAGHILGSAQIRIERTGSTPEGPAGETWVITGDYKTTPGRACEPFEPVRCDTLLTESTFGLPIYRFPPSETVEAEINEWWAGNAARGRTSMLLAYSLGKAQRVLAGLDATIGPIGVHGAILPLNEAYEAAGVRLPSVIHARKETAHALKGVGMIIAPPSAAEGPWARIFAGADGAATASVSGWMRVRGRRRWQALDRGFVMSDHADWPGLLDAITNSGATRVGVTHGATETLARYLRETRSLDTFTIPTRFTGESEEPTPKPPTESP